MAGSRACATVEDTWGKELKMLGLHLGGWESWFTQRHGSKGQEILASATQGQYTTVAKVLRVRYTLTIPTSWAGVPRSPLKQGTVIKIKYKFLSEWTLARRPLQSPQGHPDLAGTWFSEQTVFSGPSSPPCTGFSDYKGNH